MNDSYDSSIAANKPLPNSVLGKYTGWSGRAQQYPVFSPKWYKYRALTFLPALLLLAAILAVATMAIPNQKIDMALSSAYLFLALMIALYFGRLLAVAVCQRHWSKRKEAIGVVLAIMLGLGASYLMFKQAQHYTQKMESESQVRISAGSGSANDQIGVAIKNNPALKFANTVILIIVWLWASACLDLLTYFRQQRAIKAMQNEQRIARYKQERNEAEMRLSILASQVEPHFLFNTLSGVRSAIISDPAKGVAIIDHLVEYLRATIPQLRNDGACSQATVEAQFQAIRAYLGVIHFRIPRLSFAVDVAPELANYTLPPLMLISLVENAVKHGVELKKGPVHISVTAKKIKLADQEQLIFAVNDNGLGFSGDSSGSGIGLSNIRERLQQLYGDRGALTLETNDEGGVCASISIPVLVSPPFSQSSQAESNHE